MAFGGFPFSHVFRLTGVVPDNVYIDLNDGNIVAFQRVLTYSLPANGWVLELTLAETRQYERKNLTGHLVVDVGGIDYPVALVSIFIQSSLTDMRA